MRRPYYALLIAIIRGTSPEISFALYDGLNFGQYGGIREITVEDIEILKKLSYNWQDIANYYGYRKGTGITSHYYHLLYKRDGHMIKSF